MQEQSLFPAGTRPRASPPPAHGSCTLGSTAAFLAPSALCPAPGPPSRAGPVAESSTTLRTCSTTSPAMPCSHHSQDQAAWQQTSQRGGTWGRGESKTHEAGCGGAADSRHADSLLLLGLLLATAAPDNADEEEEEKNSDCHSHSNERPFGYWCNVQGAEMNRRVKTKQKHIECI